MIHTKKTATKSVFSIIMSSTTTFIIVLEAFDFPALSSSMNISKDKNNYILFSIYLKNQTMFRVRLQRCSDRILLPDHSNYTTDQYYVVSQAH